MTITAFMGETINNGVIADLATLSLTGAYVGKGATVGSLDDVAILGNGNFQSVTALGDVFGVGYAIEMREDTTSSGNKILVGANADVSGFASSSNDGTGIGFFGLDDELDNRGSISGDYSGVSVGTFDTAASYDKTMISNRGDISGFWKGIDHQSMEKLVIRNFAGATIESDNLAVSGSFGVDKLVNRGQILGDVDLSGGDDIYDGRKGGTVDGTISGGSGNDYIHGGSDDDLLCGSYGKDTLIGGGGSDTFLFNSSISGANDADYITDFDVTNDTIALDHNIFGALGSNLAPTIIASKGGGRGTVGNEIIVYDDGSGRLYYDPTGKHHETASGLFAVLDPHLKLTAANFEIV